MSPPPQQTSRRQLAIAVAALALGLLLRLLGLAWRVGRGHWVRLGLLFALVVVPLNLFGELAEAVREDGGYAWDRAALELIQAHLHGPLLDRAMVLITDIGRIFVLLPVAVALALAAYRSGMRMTGAYICLAYLGAVVINYAAKLFYLRQRPDLYVSIYPEPGYSFPSGHAMGSAAFATAVVLAAWRTRFRWLALATMPAFALLVGFSRLYLGVHFPSDVLAGWLAGVAWAGGAFLAADGHRAWRARRSRYRH